MTINSAPAGSSRITIAPAAPGRWPWRPAALLFAIAVQLITIPALPCHHIGRSGRAHACRRAAWYFAKRT
jgi:hypothetical protein